MFEKAIEFRLGGNVIASAGTINIKTRNHFDIDHQVAYAEIELNTIFDFYSSKKFKVSPIPQFPFSKRDYAIMIDNHIDFKSIKEKSFKIDKKLLYKVDLFDVYKGKELAKNKKLTGLVFISTIVKELLQIQRLTSYATN